MRAIRMKKNGDAGVLELEEIPTPVPGDHQALVRVEAAGLNFIDIYQRSGRYSVPLPYTPGLEGAGIVEAVGKSVTDVKKGDRVAYTGHPGSYAEMNVIDAGALIPLPPEITFDQGASFPLQGMTAQYLLHDYHSIQPGEWILIHAAAGGVGLLLVQWAKRLGARVIGTVSSDLKARIAQEAGADHIIIYTRQNFVEEAKRITGGSGPDLIIDGVGKSTFPGDLEAVKLCGHVILFGSASGPADPIGPNSLQARSLTISAGTLFNFIRERESLLRRANQVLQGLRDGWLKLRIDHIYPLEKAAEAQRLLEGRGSIGKIILKPGLC